MNEPIEAACAGNALVQGAARDPAQCVWCVREGTGQTCGGTSPEPTRMPGVRRATAYPYPVARSTHVGYSDTHRTHRCSSSSS